MTEPKPTEQLDGRRQRTERSKTAIAKAFIEIVRETGSPPTAETVAERAKVSRRSVFRHFEEMDDLFSEVINLTREEIRARIGGPGLPGLPLPERITGYIGRITSLYEDVTPMRRLAESLRGKHAVIDARLHEEVRDLGMSINALFGRDLKAKDSTEREVILSGLELALSWQAWDTLRKTQDLSAKKAREVTRRLVSSLLQQRS